MQEKWLTLLETAKYMRVSPSTIYRMVLASDRRLPHARVGKEYRFRASDIDAYIKSAGSE